MWKFIKRLFSIAFGLAAIICAITVFDGSLDLGVRVTGGVFAALATFIALAFWGSTMQQTPENTAMNSEIASSAVASKAGAQTTQTITQENRTEFLRRHNRLFSRQKHRTGLPSVDKKTRIEIALEDDGIDFSLSDDGSPIFTIEWSSLSEVFTSDEASVRTEATSNAFRTAEHTRGVSLLGTLVSETARVAFITEYPLIIRFKMDANDQYLSAIVFDTLQNKEIAERINAVRNGALAALRNAPHKKSKIIRADHGSTIDQIERLANLYERGLLTEEEFATQKQRLLSQN